MLMEIKSGAMVTLTQLDQNIEIKARRVPETITYRYRSSDYISNHNHVVICKIPNGTRALYMCTSENVANANLIAKGAGPYGFKSKRLLFHCVLWGARPVWVSSAEADLKPC